MKLEPKPKVGKNGAHIRMGEDIDVSEIAYISSRGSFDPVPMVTTGTLEAGKLPTLDRKRLLEECYRLWKYDAIGGTIVSLTTYFVLGRGVSIQFDNEAAQYIIKKFYAKNDLEIKLRRASDESTAFGEAFIWLRPKRDEQSYKGRVLWRAGDVQATFIQPENITSINVSDEDFSDVYSYHYEYMDANRVQHTIEIPDISKFNFNGRFSDKGCIIHVKFNVGNIDPFGHSDLIRIKEWLDNYQEYLRDGVIINKLYRSPCYDVSIEDGTPEEIDAAIARYRGWKIGSNPVHNSKETWQILEFTGPNTSSETARRSLLLIIAAGVGFAEYMLADGANANLASTKSQQLPVIKKFEDRQDIWEYYLNKMFQFVLEAKAKFGRNSGLAIETDSEGDPVPYSAIIKFPAIAQDRDLEVAQTNKEAIQNGYMSLRTAAARLGLDFDREVEIMLKDKTLVDKLAAVGVNIVIGQPPEPEPAAPAAQ